MSDNSLHFAVVVGIKDYPADEIPNLKHSIRDAVAFHEWLTDVNGGNVPKENATLIRLPEDQDVAQMDINNAEPNRDIVQRVIMEKIKAAEAAYDEDVDNWAKTRFYYYVSGHGFAPEAGEAALLMANAGDEFYGENLGSKQLMEYLQKRQPFKDVVMFADCCRDRHINAPVGGVSFNREDIPKGTMKSMTGFATSYGLKAYEPLEDEEQLSYFTKVLLDGLKGDALSVGERDITCKGLEDYIDVSFITLRKAKVTTQIPDIDSNGGDPIILCSPKIKKKNVVLTFPDGFHEKVRVQDGSFKLINDIAEYDTANGPWHLDLPMGLFKVVKAEDEAGLELQGFGVFQIQAEEVEHEFVY